MARRGGDLTGPGAPSVAHTVTVVVARLDRPSARHETALRQAVIGHRGDEVACDGVGGVFTSASAAVAAAVAMQQSVTRLNRRSGKAPVRAAVAMAVGEATFDDVAGWSGLPVAEAEELARTTDPDRIEAGVVVADLLRPAGGFRFEGTRLVWDAPHADMPVPAALVNGAGAAPFVGRSDEVEQLRLAWKQAADGTRRVVFVVGQPGIGKTRLAAETAAWAAASGGTVLYGRSDEQGGGAYEPFAQALAHFAAHSPDVVSLLGPNAGELVRLVPALGERVRGLPRPLKAEPDTERARLFDAVTGWLSAASRTTPLLLVLDDLHWATPPTLLLLRHITRAVDPMSVLIIAIHRDGGTRGDNATELLAEIRRDGGIDRIALDGLDEDEVGAMVGGSTAVARSVVDATRGNPFLVGEVARHLSSSGELAEGSQVVRTRLATMRGGVRRVLEAAAVIGSEVDTRLLDAVLATDDRGLVDAAVDTRLVERVPGSEGRVRFAHALVRERVLADLDPLDEARLRAAIVDSWPPGDGLVALADHVLRVARRDRARTGDAVEVTLRAAEELLAQLAYEQAALLLGDALALGPIGRVKADLLLTLADALWACGQTADARAAAVDAAAEIGDDDPDVLGRAALAAGRAGVTPGVVDAELVDLLRRALDALGRGDSALRAAVTARLATELYYEGAPSEPERHALATGAVAMARRLADPAALAAALEALRFATWSATNLGERLAASTELVERARQAGDVELVLRGRMWRIVDLLETGDVRGADDEIARFERAAIELNQPSWLWYAAQHKAMRALLCDSLDEAEALVEAALVAGQGSMSELAFQSYGVQVFVLRWGQGRLGELAGVFGDFVASYPAVPAYQAGLGLLHASVGDVDEARSLLVRLTGDGVAALPDDANRVVGLCLLSLVAQRVGDRGAAAILHRALAPFADHLVVVGPRSTACVGMANHYLAGLAALLGRDDEADARYGAVLTAHEAMGARPWATRTRTEWGRALAARGDGRARAVLERAIADAGELRMAGLAAAAEEALASRG